MTAFDSGREGSMTALFDSPADWISPQNDGASGDYMKDPPVADGRKVMLSDTDHLWGVGGDRVWVWKSFTRGHQPIYMDTLKMEEVNGVSGTTMEGARRAMGQTRRFAERIDLGRMVPQPASASTRFCLASPGLEYMIYQPKAGESFTVDLKAGTYRYEWFDPTTGAAGENGFVEASGGEQRFQSKLENDSVLYLKAR
jgi:hypothetical protein